jgi:hypothetical protein
MPDLQDFYPAFLEAIADQIVAVNQQLPHAKVRGAAEIRKTFELFGLWLIDVANFFAATGLLLAMRASMRARSSNASADHSNSRSCAIAGE